VSGVVASLHTPGIISNVSPEMPRCTVISLVQWCMPASSMRYAVVVVGNKVMRQREPEILTPKMLCSAEGFRKKKRPRECII